MAKVLFPSGRPWVGFYTYSSRMRRYLMDLHLPFHGGKIKGEGADGLDFCSISGTCDERKLECAWQKIHPTRPAVAYSGSREGKGIWGIWSLPSYTGGFHIWPLTEGGPPDLRESEAEEESVELVTIPVAPLRL
jgi:hypothetical protein